MEKSEKQLTYETPEVEMVEVKAENSFVASGGCSTHCEGDIEGLCDIECQHD